MSGSRGADLPLLEREHGTFAWRETEGLVRTLLHSGHRLIRSADVGSREGHYDVHGPAGRMARLQLPLALGSPDDLAQWLANGPPRLGAQMVLLLQAGATALGVRAATADGDAWRVHKVIKKYVVRGNGKAQSTHLKTKGKSRYGSRLRLQNHRRLLDQLHERVVAQTDEHGPIDRAWVGAPDRLLAEFLDATPGLPFAEDVVQRLPFTAHRPGFDELERTWRRLSRGRWTREPDSAAPSD